MASQLPVVLSPALPSELLSYIVTRHVYPTTLIICCSREEFIEALGHDVQQQFTHPRGDSPDQVDEPNRGPREHPQHLLLSAPLYQVAIARHIRMIFVPTVSHLRGLFSVFSLDDSKVPPPPVDRFPSGDGEWQSRPLPPLLVYGFLDMHRDTSEWSAQGLGTTAAGLVEAAKRSGFQAVIVDQPTIGVADVEMDSGQELEVMLAEEVPLLSGGVRRMAPDTDEGGWTGRTVEVRRVLGRWFHFEGREWNMQKKGNAD